LVAVAAVVDSEAVVDSAAVVVVGSDVAIVQTKDYFREAATIAASLF
jgi:selenophosphate synthase